MPLHVAPRTLLSWLDRAPWRTMQPNGPRDLKRRVYLAATLAKHPASSGAQVGVGLTVISRSRLRTWHHTREPATTVASSPRGAPTADRTSASFSSMTTVVNRALAAFAMPANSECAGSAAYVWKWQRPMSSNVRRQSPPGLRLVTRTSLTSPTWRSDARPPNGHSVVACHQWKSGSWRCKLDAEPVRLDPPFKDRGSTQCRTIRLRSSTLSSPGPEPGHCQR